MSRQNSSRRRRPCLARPCGCLRPIRGVPRPVPPRARSAVRSSAVPWALWWVA